METPLELSTVPFLNLQEVKEHEPFPGYRHRFVHSETMTIAHFSIEAGAAVPEHSHPHEQVANVIKGEFELTWVERRSSWAQVRRQSSPQTRRIQGRL